MAFAVITDVHSNLVALEAVLKNIEGKKVDNIYFTGDVVGYGPKPMECIDLVKKTCSVTLAGNHDWAVIGYTDITYFNEHALKASLWTRSVLSDEYLETLVDFKLVKNMEELDAFFVHSTPEIPEAWRYIFTINEARESFKHFKHKFCFIGHSHFPGVFELKEDGEVVEHKSSIKISDTSRYIVNSGSVGQPRDKDPRSCYTYITDEAINIVRVKYDIASTQMDMVAADLPPRLVDRLSYGI